MKTSAVRAVTLSLMVLALAAASDTRAADSSVTSGAVLENATGEQVYTHICQGCHMADAQGAVGAGHFPKLASDATLVSADFVALTVLNGRNGMPSFGLSVREAQETFNVHLSDEQIAEVVNYVRSHFGNHYKDSVTAAHVTALPHPGNAAAH